MKSNNKNNICFCSECREMTTYKIGKRHIKYTLGGRNYDHIVTGVYCNNCNELMDIPGLIDLNTEELSICYRKEEDLVFIDDINNLMKMYDMGKSTLSLALGFGEITITRYLNGQYPSKEYSNVIKRALSDESFMKECIIKNRKKIGDVAYNKTLRSIKKIEEAKSNLSSNMLLVISNILENSLEISPLTLEKLLYYVEALYMVFYDKRLFKEDCQAWVHGPVYKNVYNLFKDYKYYAINDNELLFIKYYDKKLNDKIKYVLDLVLDTFGNYSGRVLENISHIERPWINARKDLICLEPSSEVINIKDIKDYFKEMNDEYDFTKKQGIEKYIKNAIKLSSKVN